ncbi:hypothetical protein OG21DRAFT_912036 [Imleria badia]|jgi:hypothetical protein|nr:hypothetical protein OG21DRAFT_912036 [Imleria badia]
MFLTSLGGTTLGFPRWTRRSIGKSGSRGYRDREPTLSMRTAVVIFIILVLRPQDPTGLVNAFIPNYTKVWRQPKAAILEQLPVRHPRDQSLSDSKLRDRDECTQEEQDLLNLSSMRTRGRHIMATGTISGSILVIVGYFSASFFSEHQLTFN